jgi:hypothetical protein
LTVFCADGTGIDLALLDPNKSLLCASKAAEEAIRSYVDGFSWTGIYHMRLTD